MAKVVLLTDAERKELDELEKQMPYGDLVRFCELCDRGRQEWIANMTPQEYKDFQENERRHLEKVNME